MKKNPNKKGRSLLLLGLLFLTLGNTLFREERLPKYLMLGASIVLLLLSIYFNTRTERD